MWLSSSYCSYQTVCALRAVAAGERAHVAGDHHAVAGADARLVARRPLVLTVGALADEQRDRRRSNAVRIPAGAHDQLVDALDVERDALGSRVLGFGQVFPLQTPFVGFQYWPRTWTIDLVCISSKSFTPLALRYVLNSFSFSNARVMPTSAISMTPPQNRGALDVVQVVRRVDEQAAHGRADQSLVDVGRVGRGELGGPLGGERTAGVSEHRNLCVARRSTVFELNAARIESSVFIPYSGPAAKSALWPSMSGTMTVYPSARNGPKTAASTLGTSPPSLGCPPEIAYDGSSLWLSES